MIRQALSDYKGNISETARALGLTRRGLYLKMRRLGIDVGETEYQVANYEIGG